MFALDELHLDSDNPRFASNLGDNPSETEVLDAIVTVYGLDDIISSIAFNGYFGSEPLIGVQKRDGSRIYIVEGNRRLASCLILTGDERAKNQLKRREPFEGMPGTKIKELPVAIFRNRELILPYLGVRHIAGSKPWDGYAKAAWIVKVLEENPDFTLQRITEMTGDQHRTVARMVEGYYFVQQLIDSGRFVPSNSMRSGRGSNTEYPFSWTYTILGFTNVREWLGIKSSTDKPTKKPVDRQCLDRAEELMDFMFGNKSKPFSFVVGDSRDLQELAKATAEPKVLAKLRQGIPVKKAMQEARQAGDRIEDGLAAADTALGDVQLVFGGGETLNSKVASRLEPTAKCIAQGSRESRCERLLW
jgi:hypothetical protein